MFAKIRHITDSVGVDTNGEGISRNYFFAGCSFEPKCKNCHNPGLWKAKVEDIVLINVLIADIQKTAKNCLATHVVFVGGEPLDQPEVLLQLAIKAQEVGLTTWLYTGYEYDDVPIEIKDTMDVVVAGPYKESLKTNGFPGSSNQKIVRRKPSL